MIRTLAAGATLAAAVLFGGAASAGQDTPESLRAEAFEAAQWAIASEAADALAKVSARFAQGDDALGRLAEERETLISRRDGLERELERLYAVADGDVGARRTAVRSDYEGVLQRLKTVDGDIETRFPAYAELTSPRALTVAETQGLLKPDEGLLLIFVNPEATYVWGVTRDRVEWARSESLNEEAMNAAVASRRASTTSISSTRQASSRSTIVSPG